jgi:hypothetical protein
VGNNQGVEAVGGSRGVRDGAMLAIEVFFALFIGVIMLRAFAGYYRTIEWDRVQAPARAPSGALRATPTAAPAPKAAAAPVAPAAPRPQAPVAAPPAAAPGPKAPAAPAAPAAKPAPAAKAVAPAVKMAEPSPLRKFIDQHPYTIYRLPIFVLIILLGGRLILSLRQVDRLYAQSEAWAGRSFTGLLIHVAFLLAQVSLLAFMAMAMQVEETGDSVAIFFMGLLAISGLWYLWAWLTAGREDGPVLRYALPAGIADFVFGAITFLSLFLYEYLRHGPERPRAEVGGPATIAAFVGLIAIFVNYVIAVQAPDDPERSTSHAWRAWASIVIGIIACGVLIGGAAFLPRYGIEL